MIKRFALDRLAATGALDEARSAHAQFFYDLARGPLLELFDDDYRSGRDQFLRELDNLRAVVERSAPGVHGEPYGDAPIPPLHVARILVNLAHKYRRYSDGLAWCDTSLASPAATRGPPRSRCRPRDASPAAPRPGCAARHAHRGGRGPRGPGGRPGRERPARRSLGDPRRTEEFVGYDAGYAHSILGDNDAARAEADRLREICGDDADGLELALDLAFLVAYYEEDFDRARDAVAELESLARASQSHATTRANDLADMDLQQGKPRAAQARLSRAAEEIIAVGDPDTLIIAALTFGAAIGDLDPLLCAGSTGARTTRRSSRGSPTTSTARPRTNRSWTGSAH